MTLRHGPRPFAVRAFAVLFLLQAAAAFWHQMSDLPATEALLAARIPQLAFDRDAAIVVTCARLTIALIPVALIWFFGSRLARILVLLFVALRLLDVPVVLDLAKNGEVLFPASLTLAIGAAMLLLSPSAAGWFQRAS